MIYEPFATKIFKDLSCEVDGFAENMSETGLKWMIWGGN